MFGKLVDERCICGEQVRCRYGAAVSVYVDEKGEFYVAKNNRCPKCGHIINFERIVNAEFKATAFF